MRYAPALLGALVATPAVAVVGLDPAETPRADWLDALPPGLARTAGPALDGPCLGTLRCINIPFLVDESGDTMTGKLTLAPGADLACAECVHPEDVAFGYAHSASKGGKAADAELLDGLDAAQFLRSDQSGVLGGDLAVAGMLRPGGLVLPALGRAALPPPGQPGRVAFMTGAPGGLWVDQGEVWYGASGESLNVKHFGARGDGVADDTAAIQAAIDAMPRPGEGKFNGGTLVFPPGVYHVNRTLTIRNQWGIRMVGSGSAPNTYTGTVLEWRGNASVPLLRLVGVRDSYFGYFT